MVGPQRVQKRADETGVEIAVCYSPPEPDSFHGEWNSLRPRLRLPQQ